MDPFESMPTTPNKTIHTRSSSETDLSVFNEASPAPKSTESDSGLDDLRFEKAMEEASRLNLDGRSETASNSSAEITADSKLEKQVAALGPYVRVEKSMNTNVTRYALKKAQWKYPPEACVFVGK